MKKRTLIHDIATYLDVSITTVSFVLNGKAKEYRISDAVAERVMQYAEQVGYKPNQLANRLRTGKTHVIGLIVEDISNPFFATMARLIERLAAGRGYRMLYCSTDNDAAKAKDLLALFQEQHLDGYIIAPPAGAEAELEVLLKSNTPTVFFDRYLPGLTTDYIGVDNAAGVYQATRLLLDQGFARVAFLTTESSQTQLAARQQGYAHAMQEAGWPPLVQQVPLHAENNGENCHAIIRQFLQDNVNCEAVIFADYSLAIIGLEVIAQLGRRIPQELAVICFDDNDLFRLHSPPITAIAQPVEALAENLINALVTKLNYERPATEAQEIVLPVSLIVRGSSVRL